MRGLAGGWGMMDEICVKFYFTCSIMRYDRSALGFLTGLKFGTHLRKDIKALFVLLYCSTSMPTKALLN